MKVYLLWVLTSDQYGREYLVGIYSNKEKAEGAWLSATWTNARRVEEAQVDGCVHESASVAQDWRFMESETKLERCPFCGGTPHLQCDHKFFVLCLNCHCAVGERYDPDGWPAHEFSTAADAIAAWNTRVSSSSDVKGGNDAK